MFVRELYDGDLPTDAVDDHPAGSTRACARQGVSSRKNHGSTA
jgi:hypothetical protein